MLNHIQTRCRFLLFLIVIPCFPVDAKLIEGDVQGGTESFSIAVRTHVRNLKGNKFYVGANATGLDKFALSQLLRGVNQFIPLAPETVTLNSASATNPLFNANIAFLDLLEVSNPYDNKIEEHPAAVTQADKTSIYLLDKFNNPNKVDMFFIDGVFDAAGATTSEIVGLGTISRNSGSFILAAVKPNAGGTFGDTDSGIALNIFGNVESTIAGEKKTRRGFQQINAVTGNLNTGLASPFDRTSTFLKIGADLAAMTDVVDFWFDSVLMRFYAP